LCQFKIFAKVSDFFVKTVFIASSKKFFVGKYNGPNIEKVIERQNSLWPKRWKYLWNLLEDKAAIWWGSLESKKLLSIPHEELKKFLLHKWSHARKQDNEKHVRLFSTGISLLQDR